MPQIATVIPRLQLRKVATNKRSLRAMLAISLWKTNKSSETWERCVKEAEMTSTTSTSIRLVRALIQRQVKMSRLIVSLRLVRSQEWASLKRHRTLEERITMRVTPPGISTTQAITSSLARSHPSSPRARVVSIRLIFKVEASESRVLKTWAYTRPLWPIKTIRRLPWFKKKI